MKITNINRLRFNTDGTGVRTLIGFHGCPLQCKYCINPHTWQSDKYREYDSKALYDAISKDLIYFNSTGGGITLGGGEPLLQSEEIASFLQDYCKHISVNIETSLHVPLNNLIEIIPYIHHYYIDIKDMNNDIYMSYTGDTNNVVVENLKYLLEHVDSSRITVRVPHIKEYNTQSDVDTSIQQLKLLGVSNIDEFSYRIKIR